MKLPLGTTICIFDRLPFLAVISYVALTYQTYPPQGKLTQASCLYKSGKCLPGGTIHHHHPKGNPVLILHTLCPVTFPPAFRSHEAFHSPDQGTRPNNPRMVLPGQYSARLSSSNKVSGSGWQICRTWQR